jgi:hypothetical protein
VALSKIGPPRSTHAALGRKPGGGDVAVTVGDMTTSRAPDTFSLVYLVYNAITCLLSQDEQVACFRNAAKHLEPGGRFVIEVFVPELQRLPPGETARPFQSASSMSASTRTTWSTSSWSRTTTRSWTAEAPRSSHLTAMSGPPSST